MSNTIAKETPGSKDGQPTDAPSKSGLKSETSENTERHINPSAPEDSNATPGSTGTK